MLRRTSLPRPYAFATTHRLEELEVEVASGERRVAIRKDLSPQSLLPAARRSRCELVVDPAREVEVYRRVLRSRPGLAPDCYESVSDAENGAYALVLERFAGVELWQVGELEVWVDVARWAAHMHDHLAGALDDRELPLVRHQPDLHRGWLERATRWCAPGRAEEMELVAVRHRHVVEQVLRRPPAFVHGELYPSNVLVGNEGEARRVVAVDWEMAGMGPALLDLAALSTGWDDATRMRLAAAYADAAGRRFDENFTTELDGCELLLCVQWLGWAAEWRPPPEHARDWLGRAVELSERLGRPPRAEHRSRNRAG